MAWPDTTDTIGTDLTDATPATVVHADRHNRAAVVLNALQTFLQPFFSTAGQLSVAGNVVATGALQAASAALSGGLTAASSTLTGVLTASSAVFQSTGAASINTAGGINAAGKVAAGGDIEAAGGYRQTIESWWYENVPGSISNAFMQRLLSGTTYNPTSWYAMRAGSITGLFVVLSTNRTAGSIVVTVRINDVATALTLTIDGTNPKQNQAYSAKDAITFAVGDRIDVYFTSSSFTPTTADMRAQVEVET